LSESEISYDPGPTAAKSLFGRGTLSTTSQFYQLYPMLSTSSTSALFQEYAVLTLPIFKAPKLLTSRSDFCNDLGDLRSKKKKSTYIALVLSPCCMQVVKRQSYLLRNL